MKVAETISRWIRNPACVVRGDPDLELPEKLLDTISAARIICLGEMNHFVHEKTDFRLQWIRALNNHFDLVLAEELGRSDGYRVNQYLQTGDCTWLDLVPTFGYQGDARQDRDDSKQGILKASSEYYPTALFKAEQTRFYKALRNMDCDISVHGIDINGSTTAGYQDIHTRVGEYRAAPWYWTLMDNLKSVPGESTDAEISRLGLAREMIRPGLESQPILRQVDRDLQVMQASLRFFAGTNAANDYPALSPWLAQREDLMKEQVKWLLDALMPGEKLVILGHALHLVKQDGEMVAGSGPGGGITSSLGHHLSNEMGEQVVSVWFIYGSGNDSQPFPDLPNVVSYPIHSLNHALLELGEPRILLTDDPAIKGHRVQVGHMYNQSVEVNITAQADVVHFVPRVSPLQGQMQ